MKRTLITITATSIATAILLASVILSIAFAVYGINTLYLTLTARRYRTRSDPLPSSRPRVAIHLPVYNELYVVGRLLESCVHAADSYGAGLVGIYVLDDSTDETKSEIDKIVSVYASRGYHIRVVRRGSRQGFKAGALQAGLDETDEMYVAVLDADFVLPTGFLERTVAILDADPSVGFVQAKWGHLDRGHNVVTQSLAIGVDAHFLLEQTGRSGNGLLMNFNGSAGVLRAKAMREAGGWSPDTLAEDLDLSYRVQLKGYRGIYLNDLEVPGELPPTIAGMKRQQGRWARGSLQAAKKLMGRISNSERLSIRQKLEAAIHLTYYMVHPLMVVSFLLAVAATFLSVDVIRYAVTISIPETSLLGGPEGTVMVFEVIPWVVFSALVVLSTFSVLFYCIQAIRVQRLSLVENIKEIVLLVILGYGISISNSVQALSGLFSPSTGTFSRTPKYAIETGGQSWEGKKYQISGGRTTILELSAAALAGAALFYGVLTANFGILPILMIYLLGYSFIVYLTLAQSMKSKGTSDC